MNADAVAQYLVAWLREEVAKAGKEGVVLGISGGIDSAVAAVLAKRAFDNNCMGLLMPCESSIEDLLHGQLLAETFAIPYRIAELDNAYSLLCTQFESYIRLDGNAGKLLKANIKPRLRMIGLYYSAQAHNYLVLGTSNRSEIYLGYATKHGDNAVDLQVLGGMLKKEVYELAHYLQIPEVIIAKPPSAGLWSGQTDEKEMGFGYAELDRYLETGQGDPQIIARINHLHQISEHKRRLQPIAEVPDYIKNNQ